jgi:hypothetical protein
MPSRVSRGIVVPAAAGAVHPKSQRGKARKQNNLRASEQFHIQFVHTFFSFGPKGLFVFFSCLFAQNGIHFDVIKKESNGYACSRVAS